MPVIETVVGSEQLQKKKSLELAWDPLTGESLLDQVLVSVLVLVFLFDLAKKSLIGKSLVDQIFSVLMYISKVSLSEHILQITVAKLSDIIECMEKYLPTYLIF